MHSKLVFSALGLWKQTLKCRVYNQDQKRFPGQKSEINDQCFVARSVYIPRKMVADYRYYKTIGKYSSLWVGNLNLPYPHWSRTNIVECFSGKYPYISTFRKLNTIKIPDRKSSSYGIKLTDLRILQRPLRMSWQTKEPITIPKSINAEAKLHRQFL